MIIGAGGQAGETTDGGANLGGTAFVTSEAGSAATSSGGTGNTSSAGAAGDTSSGGTSGGNCTSTADCHCEYYEGRAYWICTRKVWWDTARADCYGNGMHLVKIDDEAENEWLLSAARKHNQLLETSWPRDFMYVGGDDRDFDLAWTWTDGTAFWQGGTPIAGVYSNWDPEAPSGQRTRPCAGLLSDGLWSDRSCAAAEEFICESP